MSGNGWEGRDLPERVVRSWNGGWESGGCSNPEALPDDVDYRTFAQRVLGWHQREEHIQAGVTSTVCACESPSAECPVDMLARDLGIRPPLHEHVLRRGEDSQPPWQS